MMLKYKLSTILPVSTHEATTFFFSVSFLAYVAGPFMKARATISNIIDSVNREVNLCGLIIIVGRVRKAIIRKRPLKKKHTKALV